MRPIHLADHGICFQTYNAGKPRAHCCAQCYAVCCAVCCAVCYASSRAVMPPLVLTVVPAHCCAVCCAHCCAVCYSYSCAECCAGSLLLLKTGQERWPCRHAQPRKAANSEARRRT